MTKEQAKALIESISFPSGEIEAHFRSDIPTLYKDGSGLPDTLTLHLTLCVEDVEEPGRMIKTHAGYSSLYHNQTYEYLLHVIYNLYLEAMSHEAAEQFRVGSERPFNPHK